MAYDNQILNYEYEAVKSLNEIGTFCFNESSLDEDDPYIISRNIKELQKKFSAPESDVDTELCDALLDKLSNINTDNIN
ncbi:hypothetical protein RclHR1_25480001 [Rhizophagus clarus]|uniref:Uncharacterized protein n=1 Tax=Rhizophagus clarus TaxID=94130 RepID=A0A2Z6RTP3_9GLOM|nr:hypothetical protein RclHR1_25480001 [Rhizophagus clarus]GES80695.1 hypothetical protein RCL_jg2470.t1 [Rhizophagus clarus]